MVRKRGYYLKFDFAGASLAVDDGGGESEVGDGVGDLESI
jgi:hypothetical protein